MADRLSWIYGDESWRNLYKPSPWEEHFDPLPCERDPGIDECIEIYERELEKVFGDRFLEASLRLNNSNNAVLRKLMFCYGGQSPKAIDTPRESPNT